MAESSASHINGSMECNSYDFCASAGIAASSADQPQQQQPAAAAPTPAAEHQESEHPFETDPGDHAETPFEAYDHLDLLLTRLAKRLGTTKAALRVYDPYYCEGRMVQHMARLGYESVYNKNEDFYEVKAAGKCPEYDVLVTNPPFSGDHLERIFRFAVKSNKPWCLLVPEYVARKAFFLEWVNNQRPKGVPKPSFLAPTRKPYLFTAPIRADVLEMRLPSQAAAAAADSAGIATAAATATAAAAAVAAELSALSVSEQSKSTTAEAFTAMPASDASAPSAAAAAAAAAGAAPALPKAFDVAAGSFQCVWFFSLGEKHHKPVFEWLQQQLQQQQQQQEGQGQSGGDSSEADSALDADGPAYTVVATVKEVPQLMAAPKLTPAERRWRKKLAAAGGQLPEGEQPPQEQQQQQQQQQAGGRAGGGRPGSGRQQQQQQPRQAGRRPGGRAAGGRQQLGQQPFGGRGGGRFGVGMTPQQGVGSGAGRGQQQQQQQQQPAPAGVPRR